MITSRDNKWLKTFRAALRGTGPAVGEPIGVEGPKLVEEALRSGLEAEALLVSDAGEGALDRILHAASESEAGIPRSRVLRTTDKLFASIAGTEAPQGIAALFRQPVWGVDDVLRGRANPDGALSGDTPLVVVLAAVQDPGNVGTILRSAEAFGATGAIATCGTAEPWSAKAVRASAGSSLRLPVLRGMAIPVVLAQLKMAKVKIYTASSDQHGDANDGTRGRTSGPALRVSQNKEPDWGKPMAIFIGNEGAGLPADVQRVADARISIPMSEAVESLNAGVAAAVLLYEVARHRKLRMDS